MAHVIAEKQWSVPRVIDVVSSLIGAWIGSSGRDKKADYDVKADNVNVSYDDSADVLYIQFHEMASNDVIEEGGVIVFLKKRFWSKKPLLLGITVMDASGRDPTAKLIDEIKRRE